MSFSRSNFISMQIITQLPSFLIAGQPVKVGDFSFGTANIF